MDAIKNNNKKEKYINKRTFSNEKRNSDEQYNNYI